MSATDLINQAKNAYNIAARNPTIVSKEEGDNNDPLAIFANIVKQNFSQNIAEFKKGDNIAIQALQGKADIADVVIAFAAMEQTINEVVTIKQSVLNAYNDILKLSL